MDILRYWLEDFASKKNCKKDGRTVVAASEIIEKHQRIISLSEHVENLYMHITLLQFTLNTIMICSLAFLIVKVSRELGIKMSRALSIKSINRYSPRVWLTARTIRPITNPFHCVSPLYNDR